MALEVLYDREVDVLYLSVGQPSACSSSEEANGLLIDRNSETGEVVGVTVLDYETKFRRLDDLSWVMDLPLPRPVTNFLIERHTAP
jgi:uncharacterized protein YuzE